jgi:catechol 2,3-dioxygenase-like lactoylglutathione lyase family enzyme
MAAMLKISKLIHLTHVIEDNDKRREAERFYLDVFAAQTFFDARPLPGLERDETLTLIGRTQLIPMAPVDDVSAMAKDLKNYAPGFMGIALKVENTREVLAHLQAKGLRPVAAPGFEDVFVLTRRKESCNVPYEFCAVEMPNDLRLRPEWSPDWWRDVHPLGIDGLVSVGTAVADLDAAEKFYRDVFNFELVGKGEIKSEGAKAAVFRAADLTLEVMQPLKSGTPLADFIERKRPGFYSINWKVKSLPKALEHLKSKGLHLIDGPERTTLDPRDAFGARHTFAERSPLGV